jgi:hypothetical protein
MPKALVESSRPLKVTEAKTSGKLQIGLITPGWGSSGYYSQQVLESAAAAKVFPAGTQMFLDHPSESERYERPERSVRDLAAILTGDATWDGEQLVGEAQVFGPYVEMLTDPAMASAIGVSIRASAQATIGEAEGRKGQIITELVSAESVDFVTKAGRGGRILAVIESARPAVVNERAVSHGVAEATANDLREQLQNEVRAANPGDAVWSWVRDFDQTKVWFDVETADDLATYEQAYTVDGQGVVTLTGDKTEVRVRTEYVPVTQPDQPATATESGRTDVPAPAGQTHPTQQSQEDSMGNIQVDEAEHRRVTETAGRVPALEAERDTAVRERDASRAELATYRAREAARPAVAKKVGESSLPATRKARIVESVLRQVRLDESGAANADELVSITEREVREAEVEIAEIAESLGVGRVHGFGRTVSESAGATVDDFDAAFGVTTSREG